MEDKVDAEAGQDAVSGDVRCYEVEDVEEGHPEPPNIQEITLAVTGIVVRQYSAKYDRVFEKELYESLLGWKLEFPASAMEDFVFEQRKVDSWVERAPEGAKRTINSIRFKLVEQPKSEDCSRFVKPVEEAGEEAGEKAGEDAGTAMEIDHKAAEFPLATLDLQAGMEIRLAFEGDSTTRVDRGPYFWIWPMILHVLPGRSYNAADKERNKAELNVWAEKHQARYAVGSLERIQSFEGTAWRLHPKPASEAQAQPAGHDTPLAPSRPVNIPRPRIPKRGAAESYNFEWPDKRECDTQEAKAAELERLLKGYQAAYERKTKSDEELSQLQRRLAAEKRNCDEWQHAYMEFLKETEKGAEEDEPARKKRGLSYEIAQVQVRLGSALSNLSVHRLKLIQMLSDKACVTASFNLYAAYISSEKLTISDPYEISKLDRPARTLTKKARSEGLPSDPKEIYNVEDSSKSLLNYETKSRVWYLAVYLKNTPKRLITL
ncbi:MAG: hypothetical protein Q9180_003108 [Flavoplaca navasiana]